MADLTKESIESAKQASSVYDGIKSPELAKLNPDYYNSVGSYNPLLEQAYKQDPSQVAAIKENPVLRNAQLQALAQMSGLAHQGTGAIETGALNKARSADQGALAQQLAQMKAMAAARNSTGQPGGADLAAMLGAMGKTQDKSIGDNSAIIQQAQARGLQALAGQGSAASSIRGQDFSNALAQAQAADAVAKANMSNQQAVSNNNVQSQNLGQQTNLAQQQSIADHNAAAQRSELTRQEQQKQDIFNNQLSGASSKANALQGYGNFANNQAKVEQEGAANVGAGAQSAFTSLADYLNKNKDEGSTPSSK